jgi:hypothetical protein
MKAVGDSTAMGDLALARLATELLARALDSDADLVRRPSGA